MNGNGYTSETLSPWWKNAVIIVMIAGFSVLLWLAVRAHKDAPPVPEQVVDPAGVVHHDRKRYSRRAGGVP